MFFYTLFKKTDMDLNTINKLLAAGYNVMPINADKTPMQGWKKYQQEKIISLDEFRNQSEHYALICGFNDVEVIDVDLKVLPSKKERDDFAKDLFTMIKDNIDDFDKRFVVKRTINNGYHVIYRADNIEGNLKLAKTTSSNEAIIETRGLGGYVVMYADVVHLDYSDIQKITEEERDIIIGICRAFNDSQEEKIQVDFQTQKKYNDGSLTPWEDYNRRTSIFDVIGDEFKVVKDTGKKIMIRRHGAKSPHSGYIFKDSGCMYLFSTGTRYEAQKLITPFVAYAVKHYSGDFSRAASHLYSQGFGDRKKPVYPREIKPKQRKPKTKIEFPISVFPKELADYMTECERTLSTSIDYMGCAFLWAASLSIGNALCVEVKKGWREISTIWIAIVGEAGVGKSPAIQKIIFPLERINGEERKRYVKAKKEYDQYIALPKQEKEKVVEVEEPVRNQFIVDDVTIEALINLHAQQKQGVGIFKDELAGWFKDMNKYKEGSDKEQWLSSWSGRGISVDRITRQSDYIAKPILPVLGGIQPTILSGFYTVENRENGFLDRMLFSYPDLNITKYNEDEISEQLISYHSDWMIMFYQELRKIVVHNDFGEIEPIVVYFDKEAKKEWIRIFNKLSDLHNSDETNEFIKSMIPKQKSYIPRFALIINTIHAMHNGNDLGSISKESMLSAEKLSDYFIAMNEKMIASNLDNSEIKRIMKDSGGNIIKKLTAIMKETPNFNKTQVAKELNISRKTLYNYINEIKKLSD